MSLPEYISVDQCYYSERLKSSVGYSANKFEVTGSDAGNFERESLNKSAHQEPFTKFPVKFLKKDSDHYKATKFISVVTFMSEGVYIAENEALCLHGLGDTMQEAIDDLEEQIIYLFEMYRELDPSKATKDAIETKDTYNNLLIKL